MRGRWALLALLGLAFFGCGRGESGLRMSLDGTWRFQFDPLGIGEAQGWFRPEWRTDDWHSVTVPGTYNVQFPDSLWYQGRAWYKRVFALPSHFPEGGRIKLTLLGAALRCRVWLNDDFVGQHRFAHTAAEFDVTDFVRRKGENVLTVEVSNAILRKAIPDRRWNGWWNYGGLYRSVYLEWVPDVHIVRCWAETRMARDGWNLLVATVLRNASSEAPATLAARLFDREGQCIWEDSLSRPLALGESEWVLKTHLTGIQAWSPEEPYLYRLSVELRAGDSSTHRREIRVGFRQIETRGSRLFLNGTPLRVRGVSRHEDYPGYGSAVPPERTRRDLEEIKELGCNFVRLAHYPQDPLVYDLCDELGLLVWSEIPAWKTSSDVLGDSMTFEAWGKAQLREMIQQHRHHPSVVIWSVGNEFASETPEAAWYVRKAIEFVRSLDSTRLVTFASDRHRRRKDRCFQFVDVIAINEYYGWYYGTIHDVGAVLDSLHQLFPDKPLLVSEFGAGAVLGRRNPSPPDAGKDYSEDFQLKFLRTHMDQIFAPERAGYVAGGVIWVYADFADPHRVGRGHPEEWSYVNLKGLVTRDRKHKRSFELVRSYYRRLTQR